jgi:predicted PurR-regulated permease PerM
VTEARIAAEPVPSPGSGGGGSLAAWVLGLGAAAAVGYLFRDLALPALLAAFLAYLLNPMVTWAQGFGIRRSSAVVGLFAVIGVVLVGGAIVLVPRYRAEGVALAGSLPSLAATIEQGLDRATTELGAAYPPLRRYLPRQEEAGWLERRIEERVGDVSELAGHAGTIAFVVGLGPVFAFFLLKDGGWIVAYLMDRLRPAHIETTVAVSCEIDRIIGRYLRGLALDAMVVGVLTTLGLWLIGAPLPLLLGAFTTLVNPLPYLGTLLSVSAAGILALAYGHGLRTVGAIVVLYLVIRLLDDVVVSVLTIGGSVHLHPVLVLASILAGESALGLLGMVIAVPLVTVVKETARLLLEHRKNLARPHLPAAGGPTTLPYYVC